MARRASKKAEPYPEGYGSFIFINNGQTKIHAKTNVKVNLTIVWLTLTLVWGERFFLDRLADGRTRSLSFRMTARILAGRRHIAVKTIAEDT